MCQHGNRRLAKLASLARPTGKQVALADKFDGKRFNSPNDLVVHSSGDIFFTDPPYGLAKQMEDKEKEIPFQGVYRLDTKGKVHLLSDRMERPNGIGLSPDEKTLYVANCARPPPDHHGFDVKPDRSVANERIFFNGAELKEKQPDLKGSFDGMAIDKQGNLFATGPGGVLIISPAGQAPRHDPHRRGHRQLQVRRRRHARSTSPPTCTWRASPPAPRVGVSR